MQSPIEIKITIDFEALADLVALLMAESSQKKEVETLTQKVVDLTALLKKSSSTLQTAEQKQQTHP